MGPEHKGLKVVEVVNWTGVAHMGGREHLGVLKLRPNLSETGIYILTSSSEEDGDGRTKIYIGETDNFANRIASHARSKDWWDNFIVFTSRDQNLTKAHVRYLEKELYTLAAESKGTLNLDNTTEPPGTRLPEPDVSAMREFLDNIKFVMETMGLSVFPSEEKVEEISAQLNRAEFNDLDGTLFTTNLRGDDSSVASLLAKDGKYVLKRGSYISASAVESFKKRHGPYYKLWQSIVSSDAVEKATSGKFLITLEDITFKSPSAAGAVVYGRATNGRTKWRRASDGKTLGDCQVENLGEEAA